MQTFTGMQYLFIDIANQFGLDRLNWQDRIHWVENNRPDLRALCQNAQHPILMAKAVRALEAVEAGESTNHTMGLDATASGIQILAAMSGCRSSARTVNLIDTGKREDLYQLVADNMTKVAEEKITRQEIKKPTMTHFYASDAQPRAILGEDTPAMAAFQHTMKNLLAGPSMLRDIFLKLWDPTKDEYVWAMPDGHVVTVPVIEKVEKGMEIDEAGHLRYTFRTAVQRPIAKGRALGANIVHSVDGWICREMVRQSEKEGFFLATLHDCFYAHPNYMNRVREMYRELLAQVAEMNLVELIVSQIAGKKATFKKMSNGLEDDIRKSNYTLS